LINSVLELYVRSMFDIVLQP